MLICPRCEKSMESHVDGECQKRLSRRFFLGALGTAFGSAALAKVLPNVAPVAGMDLSTGPDATGIVVMAPRVHNAGWIILDHNYDISEQKGAHMAQHFARIDGRPVMIKSEGRIVGVHDPNKRSA